MNKPVILRLARDAELCDSLWMSIKKLLQTAVTPSHSSWNALQIICALLTGTTVLPTMICHCDMYTLPINSHISYCAAMTYLKSTNKVYGRDKVFSI